MTRKEDSTLQPSESRRTRRRAGGGKTTPQNNKSSQVGLASRAKGGKRSQRKGADGERELAAILREYGYPIKRGGSMSFGDVPDLVGLPGIHIEVKRAEQVRLSEWMAQALRDSKRFRDGIPAVFHRRSHEAWHVTMSLSDFMTLYSAKIHSFPRKEVSANGIDAKPTEGNSSAAVQSIP